VLLGVSLFLWETVRRVCWHKLPRELSPILGKRGVKTKERKVGEICGERKRQGGRRERKCARC
jgi:hypothetical protein